MTAERDLLPDAVLRYAEHDDGLIDLHLPPAAEAASGTVVFLVHGGFWGQTYDRTHTRYQARDLAERGYVVATPEYRRVGGAGGWPETAEDVRDAYEAVAPGLEGLGIPQTKTITLGHSAGGHLVCWLAAQALTRPPDATVALAGVVDLARASELGLGDGAVERLLEDAPLAAADPAQLHTSQPAGSLRLVHGDADQLVPVELSRRFASRHPWAQLTELPGVDHFEFLDPRDPAWAHVLDALNLDEDDNR